MLIVLICLKSSLVSFQQWSFNLLTALKAQHFIKSNNQLDLIFQNCIIKFLNTIKKVDKILKYILKLIYFFIFKQFVF